MNPKSDFFDSESISLVTYTKFLAPADFSDAVFTHAHFQKVTYGYLTTKV